MKRLFNRRLIELKEVEEVDTEYGMYSLYEDGCGNYYYQCSDDDREVMKCNSKDKDGALTELKGYLKD